MARYYVLLFSISIGARILLLLAVNRFNSYSFNTWIVDATNLAFDISFIKRQSYGQIQLMN